MPSSLYQLAEKYLRDSLRFKEKGEYYEQQNDEKEALANHIDGLRAYAEYITYTEKIAKYEAREEKGYEPKKVSYSIEEQVSFFIELAACLLHIEKYYSDEEKQAYIVDKIKVIYDSLSYSEKYFDAQAIEVFKDLSTWLKIKTDLINKHKSFIDQTKKRNAEDETDDNFNKIRKALLIISDTNIGLTRLESQLSNLDCFIATAAYSTSTHPDLDTFRSFRDEKLLPHPLGKNLVKLYYKTGPTIAQYIEKQPALKQKLKHHLANLANWMRHTKITSR